MPAKRPDAGQGEPARTRSRCQGGGPGPGRAGCGVLTRSRWATPLDRTPVIIRSGPLLFRGLAERHLEEPKSPISAAASAAAGRLSGAAAPTSGTGGADVAGLGGTGSAAQG